MIVYTHFYEHMDFPIKAFAKHKKTDNFSDVVGIKNSKCQYT